MNKYMTKNTRNAVRNTEHMPPPPLTKHVSRWVSKWVLWLGSRALIGLVVVALAEPAAAQHTFQRTLTVDQTGSADFTTIQAAINSPLIIHNSGIKWTVLIYSGTYNESVTLGTTKENIDLIGIDRDAVIIAPTGAGNGITITSGPLASRNNTIRNLTIRTSDGHGIEIVKGGTPAPADIVIEDCVIVVDGTGKNGIMGQDFSLLPVAGKTLVTGCDIESKEASAIRPGNDWTISRSLCRTTGTNLTGNRDAIGVGPADDVSILDCELDSVLRCVISSGERTIITNCLMRSAGAGGPVKGVVVYNGAVDPLLLNCVLICNALGTTQERPRGIFLDAGGVVSGVGIIQDCTIQVIGGESSETATGIQIDQIGGELIVQDCYISVDNTAGTSAQAEARGISYECASGCGNCLVFGGVIKTISGREKETEVFDLRLRIATDPQKLFVSGTRFSKWKGPIKSSERRRSVVQRTVGVAQGSASAIHATKELTSSEQVITTAITDPDVYRVLTVTGSLAGMTQDVYVIGTDFAGQAITDRIALSGMATSVGVKPFATVTKIILPIKLQLIGIQTVSVGTSDVLGLQFPIGDATDVIEIGRKALSANSYSIELLTGFAVNEIYATVGPATIAAGDSFEFVVLSSQ